MAAPLIIAALAWLHILSAIGWLGASMIFGFVVGPSLAQFSPQARGEFISKVLPRYVRFGEGAAGGTVLFGLLFAYAFTDGDLSLLSPSNPFGLKLTAGAVLGLSAFMLVILVVAPTAKKIVRIVNEMAGQAKQGSPPPELAKMMARLERGARVTLVLLLLTFTFMVGAATL